MKCRSNRATMSKSLDLLMGRRPQGKTMTKNERYTQMLGGLTLATATTLLPHIKLKGNNENTEKDCRFT